MTKIGHVLVSLTVVATALVCALPAAANSWTAPAPVYQPLLTPNSPLPSRIAIDQAGYGVALFGEDVPDPNAPRPNQLRPVVRVPGGAWQALPAIVPTGAPWMYDVSIDPAGNAIAVWIEISDTLDSIESSTWHPGATAWSAPVTVASTPTESRPATAEFPAFSASTNASGQIVVAWLTGTTGADTLEYSNLWAVVGSPTAGMSEPVLVDTLHNGDEFTSLSTAIGASGVAAIQWTHEYGFGFGSDVEVAIGSASSSFVPGTALAITDVGAGAFADSGSVAVDSVGDVLSLFFQSLVPTVSPSDMSFDTRYRPAGSSFGPEQKLEEIKGTESLQTALAFDGNGNATAVWTALEPSGLLSDPQTTSTAVRSVGAASVWGSPATLTTAPHLAPQLTEAADGSAIISFDSADAYGSSLLYSRAGTGPFDAGLTLPCAWSSVAIVSDDDAAASCVQLTSLTDEITMRGPHDVPAPAAAAVTAPAAVTELPSSAHHPTRAVAAAVVLRSVRIVRGRLVLRGTAAGKRAVTITIRRKARAKAIEVIHLKLRGGAWSRTLHLPRGFAVATYTVTASSPHAHSTLMTFRLART
jgi:hypothetical protein